MAGSPEAQLKVVAHLRDGRLIKGYFSSLPVELDTLKNRPVDMPRMMQVEEEGSGAQVEVHAESLKALFFVKSFEGRTNYRELKFFQVAPEYAGLWVRVTFFDGETTEGLVHNAIETFVTPGFLLKPPDPLSNNELAYVMKASLVEVKVLGVKTSY
jgi:hypothetical protein